MQALVNTRLVKFASISAKANGTQTKSNSGSTAAKKTGKGFLAVLLSALSAWAV